MISTLTSVLAGDATLTGLLTGGIHKASDVHAISRQNTPAAFDANQEILPCSLVKSESATPWGPHLTSAREYVLLFFYQRFGYGVIRPARQRAFELLHRTRITPSDGKGLWQIDWANDILDMEDQALRAAMIISRYVVTLNRG